MNKLKEIANSVNQFLNENFSKGSNNRFIFFSVLSIMLVSTLLWGSTYSLFVSSNIDNDLNVYKTGNLNVTYTLSSDNVTLDNKEPTSDKDAVSIKPYRVTVTNTGNVPYKFNIMLNNETASNAISSDYLMTQVGKLTPNRLSECTDNIIKSGIVVLAGKSVDIDVRVWLSEDTPNSEIGKSFFGSLTIDGIAVYSDKKEIDNSNLIADYRVNASSYIMSLYSSEEANTVHIAGDSSKPEVSLYSMNEEDEDTWGIMLDNNGEYRYYGKNPNNYVEFNGELWRIINVSNVKSSESDTTGETRVRIIKDTKLGNYAWDSDDYRNNWADSTLMCQLNTLYYNDTIETCSSKTLSSINGTLSSEAGSLIDDALWYLGGGDNSNLYADDYYSMERGTTTYSGNPTNYVAKLGIMYPSDYAYATDLSVCKKTGYNYDTDTTNCTGTDWLFNSDYQWLMSPLSGFSDLAWIVSGTGYVRSIDVNRVLVALGVRPVAVLKSNVVITGGSGTSGDAYKLASGSDDNSGSNNSTFAQHIIDLYNTGEESDYQEVHIADNPDKQLVTLNTKQRIMMVDQGDTYGVEYRYYGNDTEEDTANGKYLTKNYVDFNGELWRIISVSKVFSSETDTTGETRVRIIKDTKIGDYAWNTGGTNNWADATLMCQLNTMYYNDTVPACSSKSLTSLNASLDTEARSLIDDALWYLVGSSSYNLYADDYYTMERNNAGYGSNPTRWTGKVGIMYPSDYAYAADLSKCKVTGYNYDTDETNCLNTDWLFNDDYQWLMSPVSGVSTLAWYVRETGCVDGSFDFYVALGSGVRPLAVLKSDVTVIGGEGTSGNPYRLGLGT